MYTHSTIKQLAGKQIHTALALAGSRPSGAGRSAPAAGGKGDGSLSLRRLPIHHVTVTSGAIHLHRVIMFSLRSCGCRR